MLFRTKITVAFGALAMVATGCATLLVLSSQRTDLNQTHTNLAHENLSGYLQLSGAIFRTFKQSRRDLLSGSGEFEFDVAKAESDILQILDHIEETSRAEVELLKAEPTFNGLAQLELLRGEVSHALDDIQTASNLILSAQVQAGRKKAVNVLEGRVDARIATMIEEAITRERFELARAQNSIKAFNQWTQLSAWLAVLITVILSAVILFTLVRRVTFGLGSLEKGAQAFAAADLNHVISLPGTDELSAVANSLTNMAKQLLVERLDLERTQEYLEQRVAERTMELSEVNDELRERDKLRRQFFADIGHEMRTPVTAIRGEAEVALRAKKDRGAAQAAALSTIVSLSEELTANVSDLFLIAREQAGVLDFRSTPLDLNLPVALGVEQMQSLKVQKSAGVKINLCPTNVDIEGDHSRIAQLVRLLISNALEHARDGVQIEVSTYREGSDGVLKVSDDGMGIPKKDRSRIFDRYVKGNNFVGRSATGTGTGLGLAIAKSITQAHGGKISVGESQMGGAQFVARFQLTGTH